MKSSSKEDDYFLDLSSISDSENQNKGKSSSKTIKNGSDTYQLKGSAHDDKGFFRSTFWDKDNADIMSEFISTRLAKSFMPNQKDENEIELIPEVKLGIQNNQIRLASKYLNSGKGNVFGMTLDDLYHKKILAKNPSKYHNKKDSIEKIKKEYGHPIISTKSSENGIKTNDGIEVELLFDKKDDNNMLIKQSITIDKKQLCNALVTSAILGDHDVNPGNMYVIYDKNTEESHIGRIDFGHAFNDLIRNMSNKSHVKDGFVLDFINGKVNGGLNEKESKFRRDYKYISLDPTFASALRESDKNKKSFVSNLDESIDALSELARIHSRKPEISDKIKSSACTIYKRITGKEIPKNTDLKTSLEHLKTGVQNFVVNNINEANSVANLIGVQNLVQKYSESKDRRNKEEITLRIKDLYEKDQKYLQGKSINDSVVWIKDDNGEPKKPCSLKDYVTKKFGKSIADELAKDFSEDINKAKNQNIVNSKNNEHKKNVIDKKLVGEIESCVRSPISSQSTKESSQLRSRQLSELSDLIKIDHDSVATRPTRNAVAKKSTKEGQIK